jgi:hypothetical protein
MTTEIIEVKDCKYISTDTSRIDCLVKLDGLEDTEFNNVWLPYTADENDVVDVSKLIYANATKGDYGSIEAYVPPNEAELYRIEMKTLRRNRGDLLLETDFYAMQDVTLSDEMKSYRQELRDLTNGIDTSEKAKSIVFPTKP